MEFQHVNVKLFVDGDLKIDLERFIEIFHGWVSEQSVDELLVDVADYRHVPNGPGVVLVGHEADYAVNNTGGRWGTTYNRKARLDGSNADRFGQAISSAANACLRLQSAIDDGQTLRFRHDELELTINDRALAPNTPETFAAIEPELRDFLKLVFGNDDFALEHNSNPRSLFGVSVKAAKPFDLAGLVEANS